MNLKKITAFTAALLLAFAAVPIEVQPGGNTVVSAVIESETDDKNYSILDTVELVPRDKIPCYDKQDSMKLTGYYTITENDKKILQEFIDTHLSADMTVTDKLMYVSKWLNSNIEYATTSEEFSKLSPSLAECGFVQKSGQCLQYNGAMAYMLAYMGFDSRIIFIRKNAYGYQHYTCEVVIGDKVFEMEVGNYGGKDGSHYMPRSFLEFKEQDYDDRHIGIIGTNAYYTFEKSTGTVIIQGYGKNGDGFISYDSNSYYGGRYLIEHKDEIKTVIIKDGISYIGYDSFSDCPNLSEVQIPDSVGCFRKGSFENTPYIEKQGDYFIAGSILVDYRGESAEVAVPEQVKVIGDSAFSGCEKVEKIILPDSITDIGGSAFYGCTGLTEISVPEGISTIKSNTFSGCTSLKSVNLPESVTEICNSAFGGCSSLVSVELPDGLERIEFRAFIDCSSLESVKFPDGLEEIEYNAFENCSSLLSVSLPDNLVDLEEQVFSRCTSLTTVHIPEKLTKIPNNLFYGCESLTEIDLPRNINSIGSSAFCNCTNLKTVNVSGKITEIGTDAFSGTEFLRNSGDFGIINNFLYSYNGDSDEVIIPDGVEIIGGSLFSENSKIKKAVIPDSVKSIYDYAFYKCENLEEVTVPDSIEYLGDDVFENTPFIDNYESDYVIFGKYLYKYKGTDTEITIPDNIIRICSGCFSDCNEIKSVKLPDSLKSIGSRAFSDCTSLTEVNFPDGLEKIEHEAFDCCRSLKKIILPDSVKDVRYGAFYDCSSVTELVISPNIDGIDQATFMGLAITELTIPYGVESIYRFAFADCKNLRTISLPSSLKEIYEHAFDTNTESIGDFTIEKIIYHGDRKQLSELFDKNDTMVDDILRCAEFTDADDRPVANGDVDGDGTATAADIVMMKSYLLQSGGLKNKRNGDFDYNGTINIMDLSIMKRKIIGVQ